MEYSETIPSAERHICKTHIAHSSTKFCKRAFQPVPLKRQSGWYRKIMIIKTEMNNGQHTTHGIVHAGFSGFRRFVARKKSRCKLIGNRLVIPHDTIPSTVTSNVKKTTMHKANNTF